MNNLKLLDFLEIPVAKCRWYFQSFHSILRKGKETAVSRFSSELHQTAISETGTSKDHFHPHAVCIQAPSSEKYASTLVELLDDIKRANILEHIGQGNNKLHTDELKDDCFTFAQNGKEREKTIYRLGIHRPCMFMQEKGEIDPKRCKSCHQFLPCKFSQKYIEGLDKADAKYGNNCLIPRGVFYMNVGQRIKKLMFRKMVQATYLPTFYANDTRMDPYVVFGIYKLIPVLKTARQLYKDVFTRFFIEGQNPGYIGDKLNIARHTLNAFLNKITNDIYIAATKEVANNV